MSEGDTPQENLPEPPDSDSNTEVSRQEREDALRRLAQTATPDATSPAPTTQAAARPSVWRLSLSAGVAARQRRAWLAAAVSAALLVAVVVGALALHGLAGVPLPGLPGAPALLPGQINRVYLDVDVPWAKVTLDGHAITPPVIGQQPPLTLAPGSHTIRWTAAPFDAQSCILSIPASRNDTCQLSTAQVVTLPHQPTAQLVYLEESLATLSTPQQAALKQAMQAAMPDYSTTAQPYEVYIPTNKPYVGGEPTTPAVTGPVDATLTMKLHADASGFTNGECFDPLNFSSFEGCDIDGRNCVAICTLPWSSRDQLPSRDPQAWYAFALTLETWTYHTSDGRELGQYVLQQAAPGQQPIGGFPVLLRITWAGSQWSVQQVVGQELPREVVESDGAPIPDNPACFDAYDLIAGAMDPTTPDSSAIAYYSQVRFISGPNPAVGCLAEATVGAPGKPPAKGAPVARFLDRFGLLYTLNSVDAPSLGADGGGAKVAQQQAAKSLAAYPGQLYVLPANAGEQGL